MIAILGYQMTKLMNLWDVLSHPHDHVTRCKTLNMTQWCQSDLLTSRMIKACAVNKYLHGKWFCLRSLRNPHTLSLEDAFGIHDLREYMEIIAGNSHNMHAALRTCKPGKHPRFRMFMRLISFKRSFLNKIPEQYFVCGCLTHALAG